MSYEGYEQCVCTNGHLTEADAYETYKDCCWCQAEIIWRNAVDETNGDSWGIIPEWEWETAGLLIAEERYGTCAECESTRLLEPKRVRVPTEYEAKHMRHWRSGEWDGALTRIL